MEYVIIRNNKALVKTVFEYFEGSELKNPNRKQREMLTWICDGVEFVQSSAFESVSIKNFIQTKMNAGDYLYSISSNDSLKLEGIHNGKTK